MRPTSPTPILFAHDISMHYGSRPALSDVSFSIHAGEVVGLLGPNGSGKSTLLKIISGMQEPSHGSVSFQGAALRAPVSGITYVPQRSGADWTFPITVLEAVLLGLARSTSRLRRFNREEQDQAIAALAQVRMDRFAKVQIGALSGGQQQRVFLARALLNCGQILLLDEPFTGVDIPTQELFIELFEGLSAHGTAVVYATHDLLQARDHADRLMLLNRSLIANGPPDEVFTSSLIHEVFGGSVLILEESANDAATNGVRR